MSSSEEIARALFGNTQQPRQPATLADLLRAAQPQPLKRKVFVSYHHQDQAWVDHFRTQFGGTFDVFDDCSLDKLIDSTDTAYVNRTIREDYITGTSITIVLCGTETWRRKYVDWEIHSTLDKNHALLGVILPNHTQVMRDGQFVWLVPDRLATNVDTGYAHWVQWPQSPQALNQAINHAIHRSTTNSRVKNNSAQKMQRNH